MNYPSEAIARVHHGSIYCKTCIFEAHKRCSEKWDDCPDGLDSTFYIYRSDEWWDPTLRSEQQLMCETCFDVLATHEAYEAMKDITTCRTWVIEYQLPDGDYCYGYRWDGGSIVLVFQLDAYNNDEEVGQFTIGTLDGEPPLLAVVEAHCKEHYLAELDRFGA